MFTVVELLLLALPLVADPPLVLPETVALPDVAVCVVELFTYILVLLCVLPEH